MSDNRTAEQMKAAKIYAASILGYKWKNVRDDDTIVAGYLQGHKDASQQTASLREENERLKEDLKGRILYIKQFTELQEEVERLRGTLLKVTPYLAATGTNGNHWLPEIDKALSSKESKPS